MKQYKGPCIALLVIIWAHIALVAFLKIWVAHSIFVGTVWIEFQDDPKLCGPKWTIEKYDSAIDHLQTKDTLKGVKFKSAFNSLNNIHICQPGLSPFLGYDIFEGIFSYYVVLYLKYFIRKKKWFTFWIGALIHSNTVQLMLLQCHVKSGIKKLSGQAIQNWRLLTVIIGDRV